MLDLDISEGSRFYYYNPKTLTYDRWSTTRLPTVCRGFKNEQPLLFTLKRDEYFYYQDRNHYFENKKTFNKELIKSILNYSAYIGPIILNKTKYLAGKGFLSTPCKDSLAKNHNTDIGINLPEYQILYLVTLNKITSKISVYVHKDVFIKDYYKAVKVILQEVINESNYDVIITDKCLHDIINENIVLPKFNTLKDREIKINNLLNNLLVEEGF